MSSWPPAPPNAPRAKLSVSFSEDGTMLVVGGLVSGEVGPAPAGNGAPAVPTVQIFQ